MLCELHMKMLIITFIFKFNVDINIALIESDLRLMKHTGQKNSSTVCITKELYWALVQSVLEECRYVFIIKTIHSKLVLLPFILSILHNFLITILTILLFNIFGSRRARIGWFRDWGGSPYLYTRLASLTRLTAHSRVCSFDVYEAI